MNGADWGRLAGTLANAGAPIIGKILQDQIPGGSFIIPIVGKILATAFGSEPTPEAVEQAIAKDPQAPERIRQLEETHATELSDLAERLKDTQDARASMVALAASGSKIQYGPAFISAIVVVGNILIGLAAMFHPAGADPGVVLYLLAGWNSAFIAVVSFWMGSSHGSQKKDETIGSFLTTAAQPVGQAIGKEIAKK